MIELPKEIPKLEEEKIELSDKDKKEIAKLEAKKIKGQFKLARKENRKQRWKEIKKKYTKQVILGIGFSILAFFMIWTSNIRTPDNQILILIILLSVMFNVMVGLMWFGTGIGIQTTKHFINVFRYRTGKYVNTYMMSKTGTGRMYFKKKDAELGTFKVNKQQYTTNPKLLFMHGFIPTYLHREGNPDPINLWDKELTTKFSTQELDNVMTAMDAYDFKAWLKQMQMIMLFIAGVIIIAGALGAYFGYQDFVMLRDGTYKAVKTACTNIPQIIQQPITQVTAPSINSSMPGG